MNPIRMRVKRRVIPLAGFLTLTCLAGSAQAQTSGSPEPERRSQDRDVATVTDITPPTLLADPGVAYPQTALDRGIYDEVSVDLILEIDATGAVTDASAKDESVAPEFSAAAIAAARKLEFLPAQRSSEAIPAKISYRYVFVAPATGLRGRVASAVDTKPVPNARVEVVDAQGQKHSPPLAEDGSFSLEQAAHGDARMSIHGVGMLTQTTTVTLVPGKDVEVSVQLEPDPAAAIAEQDADAVEVVVVGQRLAPNVVTMSREEVRQTPGAMGDPYRVIEILPGVTPIVSVLPFFYVRGAPPGNVGYYLDGMRIPVLFHFGALHQVVQPGLTERVDLFSGAYPARWGRFAGGIVAASTTEPRTDLHGEFNLRLLDAGGLVETGFADDKGSVLIGGRYSYTGALLSAVDDETFIDYRDFQARVSYDLSPSDRISVLALGSYDNAGNQVDGLDVPLFGIEFYRLNTVYRHTSDARSHVEAALTLGYDRALASFVTASNDLVTNLSAELRTEVSQPLSDSTTLRAGLGAGVDDIGVVPAKYADSRAPQAQRFQDEFGSRQDYGAWAWSDLVMQLSEDVQLTPGVRVDLYASEDQSEVSVDPRLSARYQVNPWMAAIAAVGLAHQGPSYAWPLAGLVPRLQEGLQRSLQTSLGAEFELEPGLTRLSTTGFYAEQYNLTDELATRSADGSEQDLPRARGRSFGFELMLSRRMTQRLGGILSYTLARSTREVGDLEAVSGFDRTHVVNAALNLDVGRGWRIGARGVFYTGTPKLGFSEAEVERHPAFFRVDGRIEKRWKLGDTSWVALVLEVLNASAQNEAVEDGTFSSAFPSLGLEGAF